MPNKTLFSFCICLTIIIPGCSSTETVDEYLVLERHEPREILRFDQMGEYFFGFIGTQSIVLKDGSFLLVERNNSILIQISYDGDYLETKATKGRGPGEMMDIIFLSNKSDNGFIAYDQGNRKILEYDDNATFISEFIIPPVEGGTLSDVYSLAENRYLLVYRNLQQYLTGSAEQPTVQLAIYDKENESIVSSVTTADALMAAIIHDGVVRGGRMVAFGALQLRAYDAKNELLYSYWSGGSEIALLNHNLDTLRTVTVGLQAEAVSSAERDSLRNSMVIDRWRELEPLLPRNKALARGMLIDPEEHIWLLLNHRSNANEWLVLDPEGNSEFIVELPKGSFLTHISEHHLGVRLDNGTFALFEPIISR